MAAEGAATTAAGAGAGAAGAGGALSTVANMPIDFGAVASVAAGLKAQNQNHSDVPGGNVPM